MATLTGWRRTAARGTIRRAVAVAAMPAIPHEATRGTPTPVSPPPAAPAQRIGGTWMPRASAASCLRRAHGPALCNFSEASEHPTMPCQEGTATESSRLAAASPSTWHHPGAPGSSTASCCGCSPSSSSSVLRAWRPGRPWMRPFWEASSSSHPPPGEEANPARCLSSAAATREGSWCLLPPPDSVKFWHQFCESETSSASPRLFKPTASAASAAVTASAPSTLSTALTASTASAVSTSPTSGPGHSRLLRGSFRIRCASRAAGARREISTEAAAQSPVVGFMGLGNMGGPMAANLLKAGFPLIACDSKQAAVEPLVSSGAQTATSAEELAQRADVIITMLPSPSHVLEVYTGRGGLLPEGRTVRAALFIDSSTVDPTTARTVAAAAETCKLADGSALAWATQPHPLVLDAPVSGGVPGARAASLAFMVGGPAEAFAAAGALFRAMGKGAVHCGAAGAGAAAKLCNNLALAVQMAGVAEALALGQKLGLGPTLLSGIFNSSSARCWSSDTYNPAPGVMENVPSSNHYKGGFTCSLMHKDLKLALEAASQAGARVDMAAEVQEMYKSAIAAGLSDRDFSVIFRHVYGGERADAS